MNEAKLLELLDILVAKIPSATESQDELAATQRAVDLVVELREEVEAEEEETKVCGSK